ncbi:MAG: hypothetical protein GKR89_24505 [Candidatus Latescibacteria bacterium]|nr:hypothetical protein [Candidatus Latescibacterota bacterium]
MLFTPPPNSGLRRLVWALFVLGSLGICAELLLLGHFESNQQRIPLALIILCLAALAWHGLSRGATPLRAFRLIAGLLALSGLLGLYYHIQANIEFETEMYPDRQGLELAWEALRGALPALAPGAIVQLALLGLAYTYGHPRLDKSPLPHED